MKIRIAYQCYTSNTDRMSVRDSIKLDSQQISTKTLPGLFRPLCIPGISFVLLDEMSNKSKSRIAMQYICFGQ